MLIRSDFRGGRYFSSQMSSRRQPLYMLLTIVVRPLTCGCQHVAPRVWKMTGRAPSSCSLSSMSQTSRLRFSWSVSADCRSNSCGFAWEQLSGKTCFDPSLLGRGAGIRDHETGAGTAIAQK